MRFLKSIQIFGLSLALTLGGSLSRAQASDLPSEQEMRTYLQENAESQYSCSYSRKHFVDLHAGLHGISAIPVSGADFRELTPRERASMLRLLKKLPVVKEIRSDVYQIWFETDQNASEYEILSALYLVKKEASTISSDVFLKSSAPCPGGVSIGND